MSMKDFKVTVKCGHVGKNKYVLIDFAIKAESRKEASFIAKRIPRVKHHRKDTIVDCVEVSEEEFKEIVEKNNNDMYLKCKNIQEQRLIEGFESRIMSYEVEEDNKLKAKREARINHKINRYKELIEDRLRSIDEACAFGY